MDFKNDVLKSYATYEKFWNLADQGNFTSLKTAAYEIQSYSGSIYLCESLFQP
jgi:hypothetical protein